MTSTFGFADCGAVEGFIVVTERGGIDLDDSGFGEGIGTHQLVVAGMIRGLSVSIFDEQ